MITIMMEVHQEALKVVTFQAEIHQEIQVEDQAGNIQW